MDLVEEYFKRDLSASEETQLAKLLAGSPEAAQKMAEGMATLFRAGGEAEPAWPGKPLPLSRWTVSGSWIKIAVFALLNLALIGLLIYLILGFLKAHVSTPAPKAQVEVSTLVLDEPAKDVRKAASRKASPPPASKQMEASAPFLPPLPVEGPNSQSALPAPSSNAEPASPAVPPMTASGRQFEQLSVVINNPEAGLATVKVYNADHVLVRRLFTGILPAGTQTLVWDGRTEEGAAAPAGTYQMEVQSGEKIIQSEIKIKAGDNP